MQMLGANLSQRTLLSPRALILLSMLAVAFAPPLADFAQAGKTERAAKCVTKGDSRVGKSIADKVVVNAVEKYKIQDLVDDKGIKHARKELYDFLKWKIGSPTAICGQYATAGVKHFKKAYTDEAAWALIDGSLPGKGGASQFQIPEDVADKLKVAYQEAGEGFAKSLEEEYKIPPEVSGMVIKEVVKALDKQTRLIGFNWPKDYDIDNGLLQLMIDVKRNPDKPVLKGTTKDGTSGKKGRT